MEEVKVGEYVRTTNGVIAKVLEHDTEIGMYLCTDNEYKAYIDISDIVNPSKNIIELIEAGDYVNGHKVERICNGMIELDKIGDYLKRYVREDEIKSIVTKEQFKSVEYRMEE